jgi:antitoxin component YwqK of YwqJK toxin-antitoxin module
VDGNPDGKVTYYKPSGRLDCIGYYRDAVRDSTWMYYDETTTNISRFDFYKNGRLKSSKTPDELKQLKEHKETPILKEE